MEPFMNPPAGFGSPRAACGTHQYIAGFSAGGFFAVRENKVINPETS